MRGNAKGVEFGEGGVLWIKRGSLRDGGGKIIRRGDEKS